MTRLEYDFSNLTILEDTVENIEENLVKNLFDFRLEELFKIRRKSILKTTEDFYVDMNDHAAVASAVSDIRAYFCNPTPHPKILEKLELQLGDQPVYLNYMWMIAFVYPFTIPEGQLKEHQIIEQAKRPTESETVFRRKFKTILLDDVEPLDKNILKGNVTFLDKFIKNTLSDMRAKDVINITTDILGTCTEITNEISKITWSDPTESTLQSLMQKTVTMISYFFEMLLKHYKEIDGKNPFMDLRIFEVPVQLKMKASEDLWKMFSTDEPPRHLNNIYMFKNSVEDISISVQKGNFIHNLIGVEMKRSALSHNLIPENNFRDLSNVLAQSIPYMLLSGQSSYFVSDYQKTLYFEYPVRDGTWKSSNNDEVTLKNAPLKYIIIDHTTNKSHGELSLQLLIGLKIFDRLRKFTNDRLGTVLVRFQDLKYHRLDRVSKWDKPNKFMQSLIQEGFKKITIEARSLQTVAKDPNENDFDNDQGSTFPEIPPISCNLTAGERARDEVGIEFPTDILLALREQSRLESYSNTTSTGKASDEIGKIYPTDTLLEAKKYNVLAKYSNTTSTKFYLPMTECLQAFSLRYKMDLNVHENVFIKLYDIYWLEYLHAMVYKGRSKDPEDELNDSDLNVMYLLDDFGLQDFEYVKERLKFTYLRELIALKRIEIWNRSHPGEEINTPKLLQHGWITLGYHELFRTYDGPFFAFENLDFIHRNQIGETPKRMQSFKRQYRLLLRAGIVHNDLKSSNICFDHNDECFIIDFGMSTVDDDEIFNRYDISDLMPPG